MSRRPDAGFMLVEALVTMAVSAFLLVALASITGLTFRTLDRSSAMSEHIEATGRTLSALSRDLRIAVRATWPGDEGGFIFEGSPYSLLFAAPAAGGSLQLQRLSSEATRDGSRLMVATASLLPGSTPASITFGEPQLYAEMPGRVRFAYYGRVDGGAEALLDTWTDSSAMPVAIRVSLVDGAQSNAIRIPIMVDAEAACAMVDSAECSLAVPAAPVAARGGDTIDPDDPLGWQRYAR